MSSLAAGPNIRNDRQDVGRELRRLRPTGPAHALDGAGWIAERLLAAAKAALVRSEMTSRSCPATTARIWMVCLLADADEELKS